MKVCVLGSGTMGLGIVSFLSSLPFVDSILWWGRSEGSINSKADLLKKNIIKQGRRAGKKEEDCLVIFNKVKIKYDFSSLLNADLYIEAISEDINVKKYIFENLNSIIPEHAIVATNTSSLSVTELSMCMDSPDRFIGIHFFNPIAVMNLVELVVGLTTSNETLRKTKEIINKMEKTSVVVNDSPGFIVNRMLIPMINEAIGIYAEGVASKEDIDNAMKLGANHPLGPIALADFIGTDVCLSIMETLHAETGDSKYRAHPLLKKTVRAGFLGRKVRRGFYEY